MSGTVQWNTSTLKASWNASTSKAQTVEYVGPDCEWCNTGEAPKDINVTFEEVEDCDCFPSGYFKCTGQAACLNGTHRLKKGTGINACVWAKFNIPCSGMTCWDYNEEGCIDPADEWSNCDYFHIYVILTDGNVEVYARCVASVSYKYALFLGNTNLITNCVTASNVDNTIICGDLYWTAYFGGTTGGKAIISEVW